MAAIKHFKNIGQILADESAVIPGQMFGKACLKINGKAFAAFFREEMVFKLGKEEVDLLLTKYEGACRWDPSGKQRAMKDWLQVPAAFEKDWMDLAKQAMTYVE